MMGVYLGAVAFFALYELSTNLLNTLDLRYWSVLLDPFGIAAFSEATQYWTAAERNSQTVPLTGAILHNRLFWLVIGVVLMFVNQVGFDIRKPAKLKKPKKTKDDGGAPSTKLPESPTTPAQRLSNAAERKRFITRTRFEVIQVVKSVPFVVLCFLPLLSLMSIEISSADGIVSWPLTREMVTKITSVFFPTLLIIITYYAAEVVWHEKQTGLGDIIDATPTRNATLYFPKLIALSTIIASLMLLSVGLTVFNQYVVGYHNYQPDLYFSLLLIKTLLPMVMMTILAVLIQILSPNKYLGMLIFVFIWVVLGGTAQLGLVHNMWLFTSIPTFDYSDLNQYGHFMQTSFWYHLYWIGLTLFLVVMGFGLWRRGVEYEVKYRFTLLKGNIGRWGHWVGLTGLVLFVGAGGYIYYNTKVLNEFVSRNDNFDRREVYERRYKPFENDDIPTILGVKANVDFFPQQRKAVVKGDYIIENANARPLSKALVQWDGAKHNNSKIWLERGRLVAFFTGFGTWRKNQTVI